jgi:hypothetical protein
MGISVDWAFALSFFWQSATRSVSRVTQTKNCAPNGLIPHPALGTTTSSVIPKLQINLVFLVKFLDFLICRREVDPQRSVCRLDNRSDKSGR